MFAFIKSMFRRRFWRNLSFAEMAELYVSRMLRVFALNMVTVFIAAYLYLEGFNLIFIGLYFASYFLLRGLLVVPASLLVARIGAKHSEMWGNILYIPSLISLALLPEYGVWVLLPTLIFKACSTSLYDLAYLVNFSKVKHVDHVGKQVGLMHILERIAHGASPLVGGFIAFWFSPVVAIVTAAILFTVAALPLLLTAEPIKPGKQISFKGLSFRKIWRNLMAESAATVSNEFSVGSPWNLFLLVVVLAASTNEAYATLGILSSLVMLVSFVVPYVFGMIVDKRKGGALLKVSAFAQAIIHALRPLVQTPSGAAVVNLTSETAATGMKLPFVRGVFDTADAYDERRIAYMAAMGIALAFGGMLSNIIMVLFVLGLGAEDGLRWMFLAAAVTTLCVTGHGFKLYARKTS